MLKRFLLPILLFFLSIVCFGQSGTGTVSGTITSINNEPLEMASVSLKETSLRTLSDVNGNYIFKNVAPGEYTLHVQYLGAEEQNILVTVKAGETRVADLKLKQINQVLQEVIVSGNNNKFAQKESPFVARLPLKNLENPQVYSSVPKQLMVEQITTNFADGYKNIPGAGIPLMWNQSRVTFLSRGFSTAPSIRNGVAGFTQSSIEPVNIERIESIKGPSGTLFGSTLISYGGLFNRVTKKPYNGFGGEISYTAGSWEHNRLTADINTPVNEEKTLLFRANGALTSEKSFQDAGFFKSSGFMPSLTYQISDRLSAILEIEYAQSKGTSPFRLAAFTASNKTQTVKDLGIPYNRSFANNNVAYTSQLISVSGQLNYKISDRWTSQTVFSRSKSSFDGYTVQLMGRSDSTLRPQVTIGEYAYYVTNIQQNFIGDFKLGQLRNRLVVGVDYYIYNRYRNQINVNGETVNFRNPDPESIEKFNTGVLDALKPTGTVYIQDYKENTYSAYASNVLNLTENLLAMASLRIERYNFKGTYFPATATTTGAFSQTALSPKFGLVYQLVKERVSLFGNYMNGYNNVSGADINGNTFKPEYANQLEAGVKVDIWQHKLAGTVSYYDIQVKNIVRDDPENADFSIQNGTQESKGFEAEIIANPVRGLNFIAGYAYNNSKYTNADKSVEGLRPASAGPETLINFWASYKIMQGSVKGLGIGFGGNHGSSSFQTNTTTSKLIIPAYTTLDATIFFEQTKYRLGLKVDNLTDEQYWTTRLAPQNPRRIVMNVTYKF